jgi:hypothetical protein
MADNLISADLSANRIYIHSGATEVISTSFPSPSTDPTGLAFDGTNLISADLDDNKIYIHSGISATVSSNFSSPGTNPLGLTFDGENLISSDWTSDKIYVHTGITSTITESFASPANVPTGLTFDDTNLISADGTGILSKGIIYKHSGVSADIIESFSAPCNGLRGLAYDGANLLCVDVYWNWIYKHSGVTSTIKLKFKSPSKSPTGLTYDATPTVVTKAVTDITMGNPSTVMANGEITSMGSDVVTERGFKYGLTEADTWEVHETGTFGVGIFSIKITELSYDTIYYIRAYAKNKKGISFGSYWKFKTAYPFVYEENEIEIKAEAVASDEEIAAVGGKRTLTIHNHLIQDVSIAQAIADAYLAEYKDQKTKFVIKKANPPPYEIGDFIEIEIKLD